DYYCATWDERLSGVLF
nr:immunoglobulin light chain junction region [Macaca mulatta]MOW16726.1 immunoglobulin light chain junction region [Macaca mulatta]MOW16886.1 immunoglobulin light chain junction region [Macaca mulatta]MOW16926.1 immunoglobulin light chain junction region [Macaca mulatta]MOW18327.1 immunoglobulin light chain junction region [Macaca mulatta]